MVFVDVMADDYGNDDDEFFGGRLSDKSSIVLFLSDGIAGCNYTKPNNLWKVVCIDNHFSNAPKTQGS